MIKGSTHQEDITVLNTYTSNNRAPKYTKEKLTKGINNSAIIGDFKYSIFSSGYTTRQKINKEIVELNNTVNQLDLTDIYRVHHPSTECTFFSSAHKTLSRVNHMLGYKTNLNKFKE